MDGIGLSLSDLRLACGSVVLALLVVFPPVLSAAGLWNIDDKADAGSDTTALDAEPGLIYRAGTRLRISETGWSFIVPEQWQASRPPDSDLPLLLSQNGRSLGMIFPLLNTTREALREQLEEPLSLLHGLSFVPNGSLAETNESMGRSYSGDDMIGRALAVLGPDGDCVMYFLMGPSEEASSFGAALEALQHGTSFVKPSDGMNSGAATL